LNKIIWGKNYKIPFRSNLKLSNDKLFLSNQNNDLYVIAKKTGSLLKLIPTEETSLKNRFKNNLSINNKSLFFLNTYGSLYSMDIKNLKLNWFINLNKTLDINPSNLFFGNQIVNYNSKILVSSNHHFYIIDENNGSILIKKNFSSIIKPIVQNDYIFLITKNNLIIALNILSGNIIYSYDINTKIAEFLNTKKKEADIRNIMIANNKIFVFLKNSYVIKFNIKGTIAEINKLPTTPNTQPMFIDNSLYFLNKKNKLVIIN
jgi:outer membrane protein assembly factor BamB